MNKSVLLFTNIFLLLFCTISIAHEGTPNMGFAWRDDKIEIDTARQGTALGDYIAFEIPFADSFTPYRMGDAGFTGFGFDQGGIVSYQIESTLLKWSTAQSEWLHEGFAEQIVISRLANDTTVTENEGKGVQGFIVTLPSSSSFEAHPNFRIQKADTSLPDDGAYMVFITILGLDDSAEEIVYNPSDPFALVFHINAQSGFDQLALAQALDVVPEVQLNDYKRIDTLLDWAESQFNSLFPNPVQSRFMFGFYARCYDNSVCVGIKDGKIFTAGGILGDITEQGSLDTFYDIAEL